LQAAKNAEEAAFVEAVLGRDALHARLVQYSAQSKHILENKQASETHMSRLVGQEAELAKITTEIKKQVDSSTREKSQFGKIISERNSNFTAILDTIQDKEHY
jgi:septal ring factor EnvC (AmiA/AmiB activator)